LLKKPWLFWMPWRCFFFLKYYEGIQNEGVLFF
jgi:hypothetical protein